MNSDRSRDLHELKKQALEFYQKNSDIVKKIDDSLNSLFYDSPYDYYGYLSEYFEKYAKPAFISKLNANKTIFYDSKCQPTFQLDVYCQFKNSEKKILSIESPCYTLEPVIDSAKIQLIQEDDYYRNSKLKEIINFVNKEINESIKNYSPFDQDEIDEKLTQLFKLKQNQSLQNFLNHVPNQKERRMSQIDSSFDGKKSKTPTSPKQKSNKPTRKPSQNQSSNSLALGDEMSILINATFYPSFSEPLISKSVCKSAAILSKKQLFEHISELKPNFPIKYSMPIPMITLLQNGKGYGGKQNLIKEYIILPKPHITVQDGIETISKINRFIRDTLYQSKTQPGPSNKCVTDIGSLTCALEIPQQGLEIIENAILSVCGEENASNYGLAINISACEFYDTEKSKYEIATGLLKSGDELVDLYADLINKFPRIMMIIEPFTYNDQLSWYKLYMRISKYCLIASNIKLSYTSDFHKEQMNQSNEVEDSPKLPDAIKPANTIIMPVNFYKFESSVNVTNIGKIFKENEDKNLYSGISTSVNEDNDSFISDLSVGQKVKFFKIGGFNRSERVNKINRLIEIESYLMETNKLQDLKNQSRDIQFLSNLEIPPEFQEALNNIEETKNHKGKK